MYDLVPVEEMSSSQLLKRDRILDAVIRLVDREGVDAVSVRNVAAESGVALGTIYRFFSTKEHIFAAAITRWGEPLVERTPLLADMEPLDDLLTATVRRGTLAYLRHPNLLALMVQSAVSVDPYVSEIMSELRRTTRIALLRSMPKPDGSGAYTLTELVQSIWWDLLTQWYVGRRSMADGLDLAEKQIRWAVNGMISEIRN